MIGAALAARHHRRLGGRLRLAAAQHRRRHLRAARRLYILPSLAAFLPQSVSQIVGPFLPNYAFAAATRAAPVDGALPPWLGLLVYAGYAVITLVGRRPSPATPRRMTSAPAINDPHPSLPNALTRK